MKYYFATALLLLVSQNGLPVGLGEIQPQSSLGQPLRASIALTDASEWSREQMKIQLSGISDSGARSIKASLTGKGSKQSIRLTTEDPVSEPYIGFTLQLKWPQGSLQRDYQLLLDPPAIR